MGDTEVAEIKREPNQTIYINNLNEKIRKDELKRCLYALCTQFGPILDIVAMRSLKMRGQAFVVFKDISAASAAVQKLSGYPFFDKPIKVTYASDKSDIVAKLDGTYSVEAKKKQKEAKLAAAASNPKKRKASDQPEGEPMAKRPTFEAPIDLNPPHNILFVQHVPEGTDSSALSGLFSKFPGFKDVKAPKAGLAFVFYESEFQATQAMKEYQGWKFNPEDHGLLVTYAKK